MAWWEDLDFRLRDCVTFGKLLNLSEPHFLHLYGRQGLYHLHQGAAVRIK